MTKGVRRTLWILSSLAVVWTLLTVIGLTGMVGMHREMMGGQGAAGMMGGPMRGETMMGTTAGMVIMTLCMVLTPIVMLGLDGVFIYLVVTSRRPTEGQTSASVRQAA